mmetsp:Transcript_22611/g.54097  ORF Transcript_22611/g.54097 Transcript_22611/m.54097 type:complete len:93 (-) Transcript_22611:47-325(-)
MSQLPTKRFLSWKTGTEKEKLRLRLAPLPTELSREYCVRRRYQLVPRFWAWCRDLRVLAAEVDAEGAWRDWFLKELMRLETALPADFRAPFT